MSFDGLFKDLEAKGTVRFVLTGIKVRGRKDAVFIMKHAGHGNAAYQNARRKLDARSRATTPSGAELLEALAPIFASTVIVGWEEVLDEAGKPEPAVAAKITELLLALIKAVPDVVDQAFGYALSAANFRDTPVGDADAVGNG